MIQEREFPVRICLYTAYIWGNLPALYQWACGDEMLAGEKLQRWQGQSKRRVFGNLKEWRHWHGPCGAGWKHFSIALPFLAECIVVCGGQPNLWNETGWMVCPYLSFAHFDCFYQSFSSQRQFNLSHMNSYPLHRCCQRYLNANFSFSLILLF